MIGCRVKRENYPPRPGREDDHGSKLDAFASLIHRACSAQVLPFLSTGGTRRQLRDSVFMSSTRAATACGTRASPKHVRPISRPGFLTNTSNRAQKSEHYGRKGPMAGRCAPRCLRKPIRVRRHVRGLAGHRFWVHGGEASSGSKDHIRQLSERSSAGRTAKHGGSGSNYSLAPRTKYPRGRCGR